MRLFFVLLVLCHNAAASPFYYGSVQVCPDKGCSSSSCSSQQEITDSCAQISSGSIPISGALTCNLITSSWDMRLCIGGSDCNSGVCASASQSGSSTCAEVVPGSAYVKVSCQLSVLSIFLIGLLVVLLLVGCCVLGGVCACCDAGRDADDRAEAVALIDRVKRDQHAASRERQSLISAHRDKIAQRVTELQLLTTKEELALAQMKISRLDAELNQERRARAASPPAFPTAPALRWATPHAWPEDVRGKGVG